MKKLSAYVLATSLIITGLAGSGAQPTEAATKAYQTATVKAPTKQPLTYLGVPVRADSPLEVRIATKLLNGETTIPLSEFKEIKDFNYLMDRVQKVVYQNPLILGVTNYKYTYSSQSKALTVSYTDTQANIKKKQSQIMVNAKKTIATIIKKGMTEEQKHKAIYDFLNANAKYDTVASTYVNAPADKVDPKYKDAYSTYGVMVKRLGVCQSYAYSYKLLSDLAGLQTIVVTGHYGGIPHAWNKVYLNRQWVNIDATNNLTNTNLPYSLFNANDAQAKKQEYVFDKMYWLDSELNKFASIGVSSDYYVRNGLEVKTIEAYKIKLVDLIKKKQPVKAVRILSNPSKEQVIKATSEVYSKHALSELPNVRIYFQNNYVVIKK